MMLPATLAGGQAWAQSVPSQPETQRSTEPGQGDTVTSRARPEYDPAGVRLGGFFLYPSIDVTERYRDNIYYTDDNKESDLITVLSPGLSLKSNWNNHALDVYANADIGRYADNSDEDYEDASAGFNGRIDIQRDFNVSGGVKYDHLHDDRSSPDQAGASEPVTYDRIEPNVALTKRFNRLSVRLGTGVTYYDYDDAASGTGATLSMDDRDRREAEGSARVGYEFSPDYEGFVQTTINDRSYDQSVDDSGFDRDSHGWEAVGGVAFDLTGVTKGSVFAGYQEQKFDDSSFETISGPSFGGDVTWNPTRLTSVKLEAARRIAETTLSGASGAVTTDVRGSIDHELRRNVILSGKLGYTSIDYDGITREDDIVRAGVGGEYLINRNFRAGLEYEYATRDSNVSSGDYATNTVSVRLRAQY